MTKDMKRFLIAFAVLLGTAVAVSAQSRSSGFRIGAAGLDAVYQHSLSKNTFIEGNFGLDFGVNNNAGFKLTGIYNMVLARPAWTDKGSWAIYAGPGVSLGNVHDMVTYEVINDKMTFSDNGFMLALTGQIGLEYNFQSPLQISVDLRPMIGLHVNDGKFRDPATNKVVEGFESKVGFYGNGLIGFIPNISVRYRF